LKENEEAPVADSVVLAVLVPAEVEGVANEFVEMKNE
jgi:hypothetical protein